VSDECESDSITPTETFALTSCIFGDESNLIEWRYTATREEAPGLVVQVMGCWYGRQIGLYASG
jgi:hypothetical protein